MKFFHLSDLHIGLRLINRDLSEDQKYIMDRIVELAGQEQPDAIVIAGDIYDRAVPSAEAVELFDYFVSALTQAVPEAKASVIWPDFAASIASSIGRRRCSTSTPHFSSR